MEKLSFNSSTFNVIFGLNYIRILPMGITTPEFKQRVYYTFIISDCEYYILLCKCNYEIILIRARCTVVLTCAVQFSC